MMPIAAVGVPGERRRSDSVTLTEADMVQFAALSRDFSRLHTDASYAVGSIFGQRVCHGLLGLSLAQGLLSRNPQLRGIVGAWEWTFSGALFPGDTLEAEAELLSLEQRAGITYATESVTVRKNGREVIQSGRHSCAIAPESGLPEWLRRVGSTAFPEFPRQPVVEDLPIPTSSAGPEDLQETGVFFEDLEPTDRFRTPAVTIDEYDVAAFLGSIGDLSPWYHDSRLAEEAGFVGRLVPPLFGFVLVEGLKYCLAPDAGVGIPMASLSWRWQQERMLLVGSTVHLSAAIEGKRASRSKHDRGVIAQALSLEGADGRAFHSGQHLQMFRRRALGSSPRARSRDVST